MFGHGWVTNHHPSLNLKVGSVNRSGMFSHLILIFSCSLQQEVETSWIQEISEIYMSVYAESIPRSKVADTVVAVCSC